MTDDEKIKSLAAKLITLSRDKIIVNMRFLDVALNKLKPVEKPMLQGVATDGENLFYDSKFLLKEYNRDENMITRTYLHTLFHCVFHHPYNYDELNTDTWDIATDLAIENIILEMDLPSAKLERDSQMRQILKNISKNVRMLTAEAIYRELLINPLSKVDRIKFEELFALDRHVYWHKKNDYEVSLQDWKKLSERIKTDLKSFSKEGNKSESLIKNLEVATKEKQDFGRLLEQFSVMGEEITVNDDEFDYIYYTYGLKTYGNMPLIEPLEYKDVKKIKDFVIVLDTSGSCQGALIRKFLTYTYNILKKTENFFSHINVHIVQCDNEVHTDTKITCEADFTEFLKTGKLVGYGGTDFRPAFEYVDSLIDNNEFENFRGLIYFTDGYGIYPPVKPNYESMFVFLTEDDRKPEVPWWVIPVVSPEVPDNEDSVIKENNIENSNIKDVNIESSNNKG